MRVCSVRMAMSGGVMLSMALICVTFFSLVSTSLGESRDEVSNAGKSGTNKSVYTVYGRGQADDYLPDPVVASRSTARRKPQRTRFELPDAFFWVGVPIFLMIFLSVLVSLLKDMPDST